MFGHPIGRGLRVARLSVAASAALLVSSALLPVSAQTLADSDFNVSSPWNWTTTTSGGALVTTSGRSTGVGTIDTRNGSASAAVGLMVNASSTGTALWRASLDSSFITIDSTQTNRAFLCVSFDLWTNLTRSIRVTVEGYDAASAYTGALRTTVLPPVATAWYRHTLDLDTMTPAGGNFAANSKYLRVMFEMNNDPADGADRWPRSTGNTLRIDNLAVSAPRFFVRPYAEGGRDYDPASGYGTESLPFATPQWAINKAAPGDTIFVRAGTYTSTFSQVVNIQKAGTPSRWITLRNYPGQIPVIKGTDNTLNGIRLAASAAPSTATAAYVEVRGFAVEGFRDASTNVTTGADDSLLRTTTPGYDGLPKFNGNGINLDGRINGRPDDARPHHVRIIGNTVFNWNGGGINLNEADHAVFADNIAYDNAWYSSNANSGISLFHGWNFDTTTGYKIFVLRNKAHGNKSLVKWAISNPYRISDGNGIIVDDFYNTQSSSTIRNIRYNGTTLLQNNLAYDNGGGGIQIFQSTKVKVVNNTAYKNGTVLGSTTDYGEIYGNRVGVVEFYNNILWAAANCRINTSTTFDPDGGATGITWGRNLLFGDGNNPTAFGTYSTGVTTAPGSNKWGNPSFIAPGVSAAADFRLNAASPAVDAGDIALSGSPRADFARRDRPLAGAVGATPKQDMGAHER